MRACGLIAAVLLLGAACARPDDSYVAALKHSKQDVMSSTSTDVTTTVSRNARNDFQPSAGFPDSQSNSANFDAPATAYGAPSATYGAPSPTTYGAPTAAAGEWVSSSTAYEHSPAPKPVYGPPAVAAYDHPHHHHQAVHHPVYVPAAAVPTIHQVYYGHSAPPAVGWEGPRDDHWLLSKLKFKLDFFTIGKVLLKLIIFKKIVKFIALICLLLWLPKLQSISEKTDGDKNDDEMEERRQFDEKYDLSARINETTTFALTAMEAFGRKYPNECASLDITCRLGKMIDAVDARYPYQKIVQMYMPKEAIPSIASAVDTNEIVN